MLDGTIAVVLTVGGLVVAGLTIGVAVSQRYTRADSVVDDLIAAAGVRRDGHRRRFQGHDEALRVASEQRRASVARLRRRARLVEAGSPEAALLRRVK